MHKHGLAFQGLDEVGLDGSGEPGGHGASHLQILGGHGLAVPVQGDHNLAKASAQIGKVRCQGEDGHDFRCGSDDKVGVHHKAVVAPALALDADDDIAQGLNAEVHGPVHDHPGGIYVQAGHAGKGKELFVRVVALVLHPGGQGHHGHIVGLGDGVDVAGKVETVGFKGNALCKAAAGSGSLHAHDRSCGGLANGSSALLSALAKTLYKADGRGGLALAKGSGGDGSHVNIFAVGTGGQAVEDGAILDFGHIVSIGQDFLLFETELSGKGLDRFHILFGVQGNLPVGDLTGIQCHVEPP